MAKNLYIGDWHYGHANCVAFDNRPFLSVHEMDMALVGNWQDAVEPDDTVYILGDMFWKHKDTADVMSRLPGHKVLIQGNHDKADPAFLALFDRTAPYLEVEDGGRMVVLSHYPIIGHRNMLRGWTQLYAHVHSSYDWHVVENAKDRLEALYEWPMPMYNAGAMMPWMGYRPRTLQEIETGYAEWKRGHDAPGTAGRPEVSAMLTLSTAHISQATASLLDAEPESNAMQLSVYPKGGRDGGENYGWYVYIPNKCGSDIPGDLKRCMEFARSLGCKVLCLDCDGSESPSLPSFEW